MLFPPNTEDATRKENTWHANNVTNHYPPTCGDANLTHFEINLDTITLIKKHIPHFQFSFFSWPL